MEVPPKSMPIAYRLFIKYLIKLDVLFFCLDAKEKIPKEKLKAAFSPLLHYGEKLKGLELASLRQSPLLTLFTSVPFDAAEMRPGAPFGR